MGEAAELAKAQLVELDSGFKNPQPGGKAVTVQFNPDSLKVTFANQTQQQQSAGDQRGNAPRQVVGAGATKLALQLWFDVSAPGADGTRDVRELTKEITYFMTPKAAPGAGSRNQPVPPGVRFLWGSFQFDGMMDSLEETLDFFSSDGRPLRANVSLGLSGQMEIKGTGAGGLAAPDAAAGPTPGTTPLSQAPAGASLQDMASGAGLGGDWQAIAAANGIENPRLLEPGQLIDLSAGAGGGIAVGVGLSVGVGVSGPPRMLGSAEIVGGGGAASEATSSVGAEAGVGAEMAGGSVSAAIGF